MKSNNFNKEGKWILLGIPILILIGFPMHYLYEWSKNLIFVGIFAPINESIWEHLKLCFYPMIAWWIIGYFLIKNKTTISKEKWFTSGAVAIILCPIIIIVSYYTYTGALGIHNLLLDISTMIIGIVISQCLSLHIYKNIKPITFTFYMSILLILFLVFYFTLFTFSPPHLPLFKDSLTGKYGI